MEGMYLLFLSCTLQQTHIDIRFPRIRAGWPILAKSRTDFEAEIIFYSDFSSYCAITLQFLGFQIFFSVVPFIYVIYIIASEYCVIFPLSAFTNAFGFIYIYIYKYKWCYIYSSLALCTFLGIVFHLLFTKEPNWYPSEKLALNYTVIHLTEKLSDCWYGF